jgi:hypothetical protein
LIALVWCFIDGGIGLVPKMGERANYLRFMPAKTMENRGRWWVDVLAGGPGGAFWRT